MKGNYTKVDLRVFQAIKTLLAGGASIKECCEYMCLSEPTVKWIKSAETLEEYRSIVAAYSAKKKARRQSAINQEQAQKKPEPDAANDTKPVTVQEKIVEHRYDVTVQTTHYMSQKLDKIEELLKGISQKMGYICEDLYGNKKEGA